MTLHVFGDSFAAQWQVEWQWMHQVAQGLDCEMIPCASMGCANTWILTNMYTAYHQGVFKPGDWVVLVMTSYNRQWFFQNAPQVGNFNRMRGVEADYFGLTENQLAAVDAYFKYLQRDDIDNFHWDCYSAWVAHWASRWQQQGINLMVVPGFDHSSYIPPQGCVAVRGDLNSISQAEFLNDRVKKTWYMQDYPDQRLNHLLRDNHDRLAGKILNSMQTGSELDLTEGFVKHKITSTALEPLQQAGQIAATLFR